MDTIVVDVDGSEGARAALEFAAGEAALLGALCVNSGSPATFANRASEHSGIEFAHPIGMAIRSRALAAKLVEERAAHLPFELRCRISNAARLPLCGTETQGSAQTMTSILGSPCPSSRYRAMSAGSYCCRSLAQRARTMSASSFSASVSSSVFSAASWAGIQRCSIARRRRVVVASWTAIASYAARVAA